MPYDVLIMMCFEKGSVFEITLEKECKAYFQYCLYDRLRGCVVIRVFNTRYSMIDHPNLDDLVKDEVLFYAMVDLDAGINANIWTYIGVASDCGKEKKMRFRFPKDLPFWQFHEYNTWEKWLMWTPNDATVIYRHPSSDLSSAYIGGVWSLEDFKYKLIHGEYPNVPDCVIPKSTGKKWKDFFRDLFQGRIGVQTMLPRGFKRNLPED